MNYSDIIRPKSVGDFIVPDATISILKQWVVVIHPNFTQRVSGYDQLHFDDPTSTFPQGQYVQNEIIPPWQTKVAFTFP